MSLIKNEEINKIDINKNSKNAKIINFIKIIQKILNDYILNYKYIFLDVLLKEWYEINKNILKEKTDNLSDINSIYIFNIYKSIIYIIKNIFEKNKIINAFYFIYKIKKILYKGDCVINAINNQNYKSKIKTMTWNFLIINNNILKENAIEETNILFNKENSRFNKLAKKIFMDILIYRNIKILKKEKCTSTLYIKYKYNNIYNEDIYNKSYIFNYFTKWKNNISINNLNLYNFYFSKIRHLQCNNIIHIYQRRIRNIYNIFINNYSKYYSYKYNNNEKNKLLIFKSTSLLEPIKKCFNNRKLFSYELFILLYYSKTKHIFLFYSLLYYINKYLFRHKNTFFISLKIFAEEKKNNTKYMYYILSSIISFDKCKIISFCINSIIKKLLFDSPNNKSNIKQYKYYNIITNKNIDYLYFYNYKRRQKLLKIILIYNKYKRLKYFQIQKSFKICFVNWKFTSRKCLYNDYIQNKNIIKQKIKEYIDKNKVMQNKILKIKKQLMDKNRKKEKEIKQKINQKYIKNKTSQKEKEIKNEEKIMISENKVIDTNEFDKYFDEMPLNYLEKLESLKNKSEPIIEKLQMEINDLIKEIDIISNDV